MAAEKRPTPSNRATDVGGPHLSIEEKYDEVRQLINIGKEKGYLLYDEVNELLPSEITSSDETELEEGDRARRSAAQRRADDSRARDLQRRGDHRRADHRALEAGAEADRRRPQGARGLREARREAPGDAERDDDPRQAEVPAGALAGDARAHRRLQRDPQDRVHRSGEAAADRRDEGRGRERQVGPARSG